MILKGWCWILSTDDAQLSYVSPSARKTFDLESDGVFFGSAPELRGLKWSYTLGYRSVSGISRGARETNVDANVFDFRLWDEVQAAFQADVLNRTPGTLRSVGMDGGVWESDAYVFVSAPDTVIPQVRMITRLTVVLVDGLWRRDRLFQFMPSATDKGTDLDYPYDFEYDMGPSVVTAMASNSMLTPCPVSLVFYGPCTNPSIVMGGNKYQISVSVSAGGYLTVDGVHRTIVMTTPTGTSTNEFKAGLRGDGQDSGSYVFQPVPAGDSVVSWDGSYGLDLHVHEESGTPPWM